MNWLPAGTRFPLQCKPEMVSHSGSDFLADTKIIDKI
jgi:hypothetical protein